MTSFIMVVLAVVTVMAWDYWTSGGQLDMFRNLWPWDIPMIPYLSTPCKEGGTHMYAGNDWLRATKFGTITGQGEGKFVGGIESHMHRQDSLPVVKAMLCCLECWYIDGGELAAALCAWSRIPVDTTAYIISCTRCPLVMESHRI